MTIIKEIVEKFLNTSNYLELDDKTKKIILEELITPILIGKSTDKQSINEMNDNAELNKYIYELMDELNEERNYYGPFFYSEMDFRMLVMKLCKITKLKTKRVYDFVMETKQIEEMIESNILEREHYLENEKRELESRLIDETEKVTYDAFIKAIEGIKIKSLLNVFSLFYRKQDATFSDSKHDNELATKLSLLYYLNSNNGIFKNDFFDFNKSFLSSVSDFKKYYDDNMFSPIKLEADFLNNIIRSQSGYKCNDIKNFYSEQLFADKIDYISIPNSNSVEESRINRVYKTLKYIQSFFGDWFGISQEQLRSITKVSTINNYVSILITLGYLEIRKGINGEVNTYKVLK